MGRVPPGSLHEFEALVQGWGEKCCLLKLGVPTGAGPCRKTRVPGMPEKLVRGAEEEDGELPDGSMDGNPEIKQAQDIQISQSFKMENLSNSFLKRRKHVVNFIDHSKNNPFTMCCMAQTHFFLAFQKDITKQH